MLSQTHDAFFFASLSSCFHCFRISGSHSSRPRESILTRFSYSEVSFRKPFLDALSAYLYRAAQYESQSSSRSIITQVPRILHASTKSIHSLRVCIQNQFKTFTLLWSKQFRVVFKPELEQPLIKNCAYWASIPGLSTHKINALPTELYAQNIAGETRTLNPWIRSPMPYPLGHDDRKDLCDGRHIERLSQLNQMQYDDDLTLNFNFNEVLPPDGPLILNERTRNFNHVGPVLNEVSSNTAPCPTRTTIHHADSESPTAPQTSPKSSTKRVLRSSTSASSRRKVPATESMSCARGSSGRKGPKVLPR
jgi:hypothetical protein